MSQFSLINKANTKKEALAIAQQCGAVGVTRISTDLLEACEAAVRQTIRRALSQHK